MIVPAPKKCYIGSMNWNIAMLYLCLPEAVDLNDEFVV